MNRLIRCVILGTGSMACAHGVHAEASGEAEIVGVCSRSPDGGSSLMDRLSRQIPVYTDFSRMIRNLQPDVLITAVPPHAHSGEVEAAAKEGIHLFLEKPIALTLQRAASQVSAAEQSGVVTQVDFHLRFTRLVQRIKELMQQGKTGPAALFTAAYLCNSLHSSWWRDRSRSGGQVVEQAIHLYDLARYLAGEPVTVESALANLCHQDIPDYTVEDTAVSSLVMDSGALASIASSNCALPGRWDPSFTLVCRHLTAQFSREVGSRITWCSDPEHPETITQDADPHDTALRQFFRAVRGTEPPAAPITEGYRSLELVLRAASRFDQF